MSTADILRFRLELYLAALSLVNPWETIEVATLQGKIRAMRTLLDIEVSVMTGLR